MAKKNKGKDKDKGRQTYSDYPIRTLFQISVLVGTLTFVNGYLSSSSNLIESMYLAFVFFSGTIIIGGLIIVTLSYLFGKVRESESEEMRKQIEVEQKEFFESQLRLQEENLLKDEIAQINIQNKLHQERLHISNDLHDNIGSQLTYIISSVDNMNHKFTELDDKLKNKLSDITLFTKTTITQLRDTIWALNKDEISFEDLKARLFNYIENAKLAQQQTAFTFNGEMKTNFQLNSIQGVSIYRIVQEAINNSMKYAAATNVSLNITEQKEDLILSIKDDGIGFNIAEIDMGNGLENMRNRASSIGASIDIKSSSNKGTEIVLEIAKNSFN